jgi:release factor glutamine methyltransferase
MQRLAAAGCETPRLDVEVLLAHSLGQERSWLYTHFKEPLDPNKLDQFYHLLRRREQREPVAYIIGRKEFFGLDFVVNRHVLIPRPETELLIETALQLATHKLQITQGRSQLIGLDVGTGSGCIAVTLAKMLPAVSFLALDISAQALNVARQNAVRHQVANRIIFLQGDLLQPLAGPFDLIVSNPPYISHAELATSIIQPEVKRYEPHLALDGGRAGLRPIRRLLWQAREKLRQGGYVLVEIGATQGQAVEQLAAACFPGAAIQIKKDLAGLDRLLLVG